MSIRVVFLASFLVLASQFAAAENSGEQLELCDSGVKEACFNYGLLLSEGKDVAQDQSRARSFFEKSCASGLLQSCFVLGRHLMDGRGGQTDRARALELYQAACDGGYAIACNDLALELKPASSASVDYTNYFSRLNQACDLGLPAGCYNLGVAILNGAPPKDMSKATRSLDIACDNALAEACFNLSLLFAYGDGVKVDNAKAESYMWSACDLGDREACGYASKYFPR